jgi:hypothetical protein
MEKAVSGLIGSHIVHAASIEGPVYIVGNGGDFREVAVPIARSLGSSLAGVGCLWTYEMEFLRPSGRPAFSLPHECMEQSKSEAPTLLFCQAILATPEEVITMISRMLNTQRTRGVVISTLLANAAAKEEVRLYFEDEVQVRFNGIALDRSLVDERDRVLGALDDREVKVAPLMSRWLATRMFGPKPEPRRTYGFGQT